MEKKKSEVKIVATNRKAHHLYDILETFEAGIALQGTEVKSLRAGRAKIKDSFAQIKKGEVVLQNLHISPYDPASKFNHNPTRDRKLLLHRYEIRRLIGKVVEKGFTLIPLKIYFKGNLAKVELALATGKKIFDRRRDIKEREVQREIRRALKWKNR